MKVNAIIIGTTGMVGEGVLMESPLHFGFFTRPMRALFPGFVCTLKEVGIAMINSVIYDYKKSVLEVKDIVALSKKHD